MSLRCPHCGAALDEGFLALQGAEFDCPECDRTVRVAELQARTPDPEVAALEGPSADGGEAAEEPISDTPPPGRVECVQKDSQLIILILPGSNRVVRSLGCMAVTWVIIVGTITAVVLRAGVFRGGLPWEVLPFMAIFAIVFWGAGLVMLCCWLVGRFGKTYVLVEPERVVIRRVFFGRERLREYPLDTASHAELVESYRQNNQPVYHVAIRTASGKSAWFGTFLSDEEKRWLVARINRHLGVPNPPAPKPSRMARRRMR